MEIKFISEAKLRTYMLNLRIHLQQKSTQNIVTLDAKEHC